jgi:hypothetical protein
MQEHSDNSKERIKRYGSPCRKHKKVILCFDNKNIVFNSINECSKYLNVHRNTIRNIIDGHTKNGKFNLKWV